MKSGLSTATRVQSLALSRQAQEIAASGGQVGAGGQCFWLYAWSVLNKLSIPSLDITAVVIFPT